MRRLCLPATFRPASWPWNLHYWSLLGYTVRIAWGTVLGRDDLFVLFLIVLVVVVVFFVFLLVLGLLFFFWICGLGFTGWWWRRGRGLA